MARRFSQIKRGAEYDLGLTNYVDYIRNAATRPTKRLQGGTRGARRESVACAVRPFDADLGTDGYLRTRISQQTLTDLGSAIGTRVFTTGTQFTTATKLSGFRPARFSAFRGTGNATYVQSKITKLYYLKYDGDSFSGVFGALTATEEESVGGAAVKAAIITAFGAADIKRVSISPEKIPV